MEYLALSIDNQIQLLKERLLRFEAQHFEQICEIELAGEQGLESVVASATEARDRLEKSIAWITAEIERREAVLNSGQ